MCDEGERIRIRRRTDEKIYFIERSIILLVLCFCVFSFLFLCFHAFFVFVCFICVSLLLSPSFFSFALP